MNQTDARQTAEEKIQELIHFDLANPISQKKIFFLLEGESDRDVFRHLCDNNHCQIEVVGEGKMGLIKALTQLLPHHHLCIGLCDADFEHLKTNTTTRPTNLFLTDVHDIEMMLMAADKVFYKVMAVLSKENEEDIKHNNLKTRLLEALRFISCFRFANELNNWELSFEKASFHEITDVNNFSVDAEQFVQRVVSKSKNAKNINIQQLITDTKKIEQQQQDIMQLCNGHDFIQLIREFLGKEKTSIKELTNQLITVYTYDLSFFKDTQLYKDTQDWALAKHTKIYKE